MRDIPAGLAKPTPHESSISLKGSGGLSKKVASGLRKRIWLWFTGSALVFMLLYLPASLTAVGPGGGPWTLPAQSQDHQWVSPLFPQSITRVKAGFVAPAQNWLPGRRGVHLATTGSPHIVATGAGTVTFASEVAGRSLVVIDHGTLRTTYEPVEPHVLVGQRVSRGQVIGTLTDPRLEGASLCGVQAGCLHWGLRAGDQYRDPRWLLTQIHLILLPVPEDFR